MSDSTIETVALVGAGVFFVYRALSGALAVSLSLSLKADRLDREHVALCVLIERGNLWSLAVEEITATVFEDGVAKASTPLRFTPVGRAQFYMAPNERMQLGAVLEVPAGKPCVISVQMRALQQGWEWVRWLHRVPPIAYFHSSLVVAPEPVKA